MDNAKGLEKITEGGLILAVIVRKNYSEPGYNFVSPVEFPFQLGLGTRKQGDHVPPHKHVPFSNIKNLEVQEFIYVESGIIELSIFNGGKKCKVVVLEKGDMVLLNCGHELKFLKDSKIIEVKQGPYRGKDVEKESL